MFCALGHVCNLPMLHYFIENIIFCSLVLTSHYFGACIMQEQLILNQERHMVNKGIIICIVMGCKHSKKEPRVTRLKTFPKITFDTWHYCVGFFFFVFHTQFIVVCWIFLFNYVLVYIYIMHQCFEQHKNESFLLKSYSQYRNFQGQKQV